jgi:hypothetical protein
MQYVYVLRCEDTATPVYGDKELDLRAETQKALDAMSNDEVVRPSEDWFNVLVTNFCNITGFRVLDALDDFNVEDMYCDEVIKREDAEND